MSDFLNRQVARDRLFQTKVSGRRKKHLHGMIKNMRTLKERMRQTNTDSISLMDAAYLSGVWCETLIIQLRKSIWFEEKEDGVFQLLKQPKKNRR